MTDSNPRFTTAPSMNANETLILDRGVEGIACRNLITHADYAEIICRGLNVLDRNGMLPKSAEVDEEEDTALVPDAESQHPRSAGRVEPKIAGQQSGPDDREPPY